MKPKHFLLQLPSLVSFVNLFILLLQYVCINQHIYAGLTVTLKGTVNQSATKTERWWQRRRDAVQLRNLGFKYVVE